MLCFSRPLLATILAAAAAVPHAAAAAAASGLNPHAPAPASRALQAPAGGWVRIAQCSSRASTGRADMGEAEIVALAAAATRVRFCFGGGEGDCVESVPDSFPIQMLRQSRTVSHNEGANCDLDCVAATWDFSQASSATPNQFWGNACAFPFTDVISNGGSPNCYSNGGGCLYQSCGNANGLHIGMRDGSSCDSQGEPNYSGSSPVAIAVYVDVPATTTSPSQAPTSTPTVPGSWTLDFVNISASFDAGAPNEIEVGFVAGAGREVRVALYETCDAGAADEIAPGAIFNRTVTHEPDFSNETYSMITVGYNFDKTAMVGSDLWNSTTDKLTFCQVTSLVTPGTNGDEWVIVEDRRKIEIQFDLEADFTVEVALAEGTIENATETVDFDNQVRAFKCQGGSTNSFAEDNTALPPNTELAVCIEIENGSVNIADVTDMTINQDDETTVVISEGSVLVPAITGKIYVPQDGWIVKTRVPLDKFIFESDKNITIAGTVELELVDSGRRLRALVDEDNAAVAETEEAAYALSVNLQNEVDGFGPIGSSGGHAIVGKGFSFLGLVVSAVGLMM